MRGGYAMASNLYFYTYYLRKTVIHVKGKDQKNRGKRALHVGVEGIESKFHQIIKKYFHFHNKNNK